MHLALSRNGHDRMPWSNHIGSRLKPRDLEMFLVVVEQGNISKAASCLAVSRPVISKAIAGLEHTLGVPLLDRSRHGITPTLYGHELLKWAVVVFDDLKQGANAIESLASPTAGQLCIGCTESVAGGLVSAIIDELSGQYPQVNFQMVQGSSAELQVHSLRERKCDFVIARMLTASPEPDMAAELLFHEQIFVTAGPNNKWLGRRKLALAELVNEPWILTPSEIIPGGPVHEAFRAIGLEVPQARVLVYSHSLRNNLMATGRFITATPGSVLLFSGERPLLKTLPVILPPWRLPIAIITLKDRTLNPVAQLFFDCARKFAKPLAKKQ